jgi:hypothetical protein
VFVCLPFLVVCLFRAARKSKKEKKIGEADSFKNMKVKISYTLEDGHVGRNM